MIFPELPPPTALVGRAKAAAAEVELEAADSYRAFVERCDEYVRRFEAIETRVHDELRGNGEASFHELCWLHDLCVEVAVRAKNLLDHARRTLDILHKALRDVYRNVEELNGKGTTSGGRCAWAQVEALREEQASLRALKTGLQQQIGVVTHHKNAFLDRLRTFRSRTRKLTGRIRELGPAGQAWYQHLHARKPSRRVVES